ncbi:DUF4209 domain-containing protein [Rhizobium sp. S152]|uniref:DUF4209 domain-containing protein n=1 Tax=Rhizobium sp. S152 TaxID=3055038 RepID=UPI0025AA13AD|nr:DUF4209 domain-containing protein [Rhizobium sp. S152]MDM9628514.1 DUF4209 domain-containing protein [Rhizobium sp. S152]
MEVPETIEAVIKEFDQTDGRVDHRGVQSALSGARTRLEDKTPINEAWADLAAFAFQEEQEDHEPWHTYFGPMASGTSGDGSPFYSPDPRDVTPDIIEHWQQRADALSHPVLKARYADLVWDLTYRVCNDRPDARFARLAIDTYLESVAGQRNGDDHDDTAALRRALTLATSVRDGRRMAVAKDAMLARFHIEVDKDGLWVDLFEGLIANRKCGLTGDDRLGMVAKLENLLTVHTADATFDPHGAELVAGYLLPHYTAAHDLEAIKRVSLAVSGAFEKIAASGSRMQAMGWLATAIEFARRTGDEDRYNRLKVEREAAIKGSASEMRSFEFSHEVKKTEIEEVVDPLIDSKNSQQTLFNVAARFVVPKEELRHRAARGARIAPLASIFPMSVIAEDHVAAKVGGDDDADGPLYRYADFSRQANRLFLSAALDAAVDRLSLSPEEIAAFMQRSSLFSEFALVVAGVKAWISGDYVKCMFVLVPQIEDAFRNIARNLGEAVTKDKRGQKGWEVSMNLGDFLGMQSVREEVGDDIHFWIKAIFSDARGMNLRNTVAHGLAGRDVATYYTCETIIHCLLVLGAYKDVAVSCVRRAAARKEPEEVEVGDDREDGEM